MNNISADTLRRAATIKDEIESLESELSKILGGEVGNGIVKRKYTKKSGGDVDRFKAARADKPKRKGMSAAGRAKIAAAAKARWAKVKAAGKNSL